MADEIPQWAKERACELAGYPWRADDVDFAGPGMCGHTALAEFARYVAAHEEPPVDLLLTEAIELVVTDDVARSDNQIAAIRERRAGHEKVNIALRALRRGIEIERERQS